MLEGKFLRFHSGALVDCNDVVDEVCLAAADSWLVEEGRARSLQAHFDRFSEWAVAADSGIADSLPAFFEQVHEAIPESGRWFPRIEFHLPNRLELPNSPSLYLRLRQAPEQLDGITLWTLDEPDPRVSPTVKGPDLSLGFQLRRKAIVHNAEEAVLLSAEGIVEEGALSALVWWRGDVLCAPDHSVPWLNSLTRQEVFALAAGMGFKTRLERVRPADLVGLEIWALSSLHGIRLVTDWVNLGSPVGAARHIDGFQKRLRMLAAQIR